MAGEEIAMMEASTGKMKLRFFPKVASEAIGNFRQLMQKEHHDEITSH